MKKISQLLLAGLMAAHGSVAFSLNEESGTAWNRHTGAYADISVGTNAYYLGFITSEGSINGTGILGAGWGAAAGYNFTHFLGLEGGLIQNYVDINNSTHLNTPYATTRWTLPLGERFSLIGKLGFMYPNIPHEGGIVLPFSGIGASYAMTRHLDATLQYQGAVYGIAGAGLLGAGITYHCN